jgi:MFS family permease
VFSYLEGRRTTEILGTALSISFIVSSGFVKSTGKILMETFRLNDFQMPWITGMIFIIPLTGLVWLLNCAPDPSPEDVKERSKRVPMDKKLRRKIFGEFSAGLILLTAAYILLTIFRDLRDNFAADIWKATGFSENSMILTWSEIPVAVLVYIIMSSLILVKNNRTALFLNISLILSGFAVIGLSTSLLQTGIINAATWIIMLGLGTYMGYLPFNCLLFDRLIAAFGSTANAGFFIYIADSFGYLGSVGTLLFKNFSSHNISWYGFLVNSSLSMAFTGGFLLVFTIIYFYFKFPRSARAKNKIPFNELNDYQH